MRFACYLIVAIFSSVFLHSIASLADDEAESIEENLTFIGVVNFQEVLVQSTAWQDFKIRITEETKKFEANITKMTDEIAQLEKNLQKNNNHLSQSARKEKQNQLLQLQTRYSKQLQEQKNKLDRDYVATQDYLRQRIYAILRRISTEKKLSLVLNAGTTTNAVLVASKKLDITMQALEMLNQELPQLDEQFFRSLQLQN